MNGRMLDLIGALIISSGRNSMGPSRPCPESVQVRVRTCIKGSIVEPKGRAMGKGPRARPSRGWRPGAMEPRDVPSARPRGQGHRPDHGDSAWGLDRSSSRPSVVPLADHNKAAVITITRPLITIMLGVLGAGGFGGVAATHGGRGRRTADGGRLVLAGGCRGGTVTVSKQAAAGKRQAAVGGAVGGSV